MLDWYENWKDYLSGKSLALREIEAATAVTTEPKALEAQLKSVIERVRRTRPEGNGNVPDRR